MRLFRGRKLDHPTFGRLRTSRDGKFWEGALKFQPVGRRIILTINAGEDGPTALQEQLYLQVARKYPAFLPKLAKKLWREYEKARRLHPHLGDPAPGPEALPSIIPLHRLWLDDPAADHFVLSYQSERDTDHEFHCFFRDGIFQSVSFEA